MSTLRLKPAQQCNTLLTCLYLGGILSNCNVNYSDVVIFVTVNVLASNRQTYQQSNQRISSNLDLIYANELDEAPAEGT